MADKMSIDDKNPVKDDSEESVGSSPEGEAGPSTNNTQENQQPKRKGGRKPVSFFFLVYSVHVPCCMARHSKALDEATPSHAKSHQSNAEPRKHLY